MEVYIGFDSAWTDNAKAPGAICAVARHADGYDFIPPRLARFSDAAAFIESMTAPDHLVLIALDQPTRVPNQEGGRPAERVAASVVSRLGGGVQPARRSGGGASMFGDAAPVWPFLARLQATEDPFAAKAAQTGRYLIEVFPALALPSIVPAIWRRRRAAKYNPVTSTYQPGDWPLVCNGAAQFAEHLGVAPIVSWLLDAGANSQPTKSDQDRLDSVLCLLIALNWRRGPAETSIVLGDLHNGYIVTPVIDEVRMILSASANKRGVPVNAPKLLVARAPYQHTGVAGEQVVQAQPSIRKISDSQIKPAPAGARGFTVDAGELRTLLVRLARTGELITYGGVARYFGQPWHQGFGASLTRALNEVGAINRRRKEPDLMGIVVNKETRLPGEGFFASLGLASSSLAERHAAAEAQVLVRSSYAWPDPVT